MKLLLINGNTTPAITNRVVAEARLHVPASVVVEGVTARFGVGVVSTEATNAVAGHAVLDALAQHAGPEQGVSAAILAISLDTALAAAQELAPFPVVGMTAAALHTACLLGPRFGLVTFGHGSRAMYLDLLDRTGLRARAVGCETVALDSVASYFEGGALDAEVIEAVRRLAGEGAAAVVIAGAATAGMARRLQANAPVALLDGVGCAARQAMLLADLGARPAAARPVRQQTRPVGLTDALATLLG